MAITVVEISDFKLSIHKADICFDEIGCAWVDNQEIVFGEQAWQQRQLFPQQSFCHYWHQLGYEPVHSVNAEVKNFADIAYLQLQNILQNVEVTSEVVFVVSGHYNSEQLSLLLGIAKACRLNVVAVINKAVAQIVNRQNIEASEHVLFLDFSLHQANISELSITDKVSLAEFQPFLQLGYFDLCKQLAIWLNQQFILEYRYDIFNSAETEQQLLNQVDDLLINPKSSTCIIIEDNHDVERSLVVSQAQINQQIRLFFKEFFKAVPQERQVFISSNFALLLNDLVRPSQWKLISDEGLYLTISSTLSQQEHSSEVPLLTSVKINKVITTSELVEHHLENLATHIAYQGIVYPLNASTCILPFVQTRDEHTCDQLQANVVVELRADNQHWYLHFNNDGSVRVNDLPAVNGQTVKRADRIGIDRHNGDFTLVSLAESEPHHD